MDQSHSLAHTQIGERGEYTQISSAEPVNLSKSEELSLPSQNKGEIEDTKKHPIFRILHRGFCHISIHYLSVDLRVQLDNFFFFSAGLRHTFT